ncbi:MAG: macrolide ABC transporter ATP-binding protein, partial [Clostridiaceae bacterium]|nr:macrolide ABC transporter ATP-binding protein [Clostridiaceae bacterium]
NRDGITIVMITHDCNIAVRARRIIHILDGIVSEQELKPFVS